MWSLAPYWTAEPQEAPRHNIVLFSFAPDCSVITYMKYTSTICLKFFKFWLVHKNNFKNFSETSILMNSRQNATIWSSIWTLFLLKFYTFKCYFSSHREQLCEWECPKRKKDCFPRCIKRFVLSLRYRPDQLSASASMLDNGYVPNARYEWYTHEYINVGHYKR